MLTEFWNRLSSVSLSEREMRFIGWWLSHGLTEREVVPVVSVLPFMTEPLATAFCDRIGSILQELNAQSAGYYIPMDSPQGNKIYFVLTVMCHRSLMDSDALKVFAKLESDKFYQMLEESDTFETVVIDYYKSYNKIHHNR